jgi:hypothetical protein
MHPTAVVQPTDFKVDNFSIGSKKSYKTVLLSLYPIAKKSSPSLDAVRPDLSLIVVRGVSSHGS